MHSSVLLFQKKNLCIKYAQLRNTRSSPYICSCPYLKRNVKKKSKMLPWYEFESSECSKCSKTELSITKNWLIMTKIVLIYLINKSVIFLVFGIKLQRKYFLKFLNCDFTCPCNLAHYISCIYTILCPSYTEESSRTDWIRTWSTWSPHTFSICFFSWSR